jgi:hypothetical protein
MAQGQKAHQLVVAMAREGRAFMGAMAQQVTGPPTASRGRRVDAQVCRCPTALGSDAAPVWCHPRRREEAAR